MNKESQVKFGSVVYDRINEMRLTEGERLTAIKAMQDADMLVDAIVWITHKVEQLGAQLFLKPGIKH